MMEEATQAVFAAIADPTRRQMLEILATTESLTPTQFAERLPITRQGVSKHLNILAGAGLVSEHKEGRERRYYLTPDPLDEATTWIRGLSALWEQRLSALHDFLTQVTGKQEDSDEQ